MAEELTFEKVWAALMENREQMKETDRLIKETGEQMKETDRRMQETDRLIKETSRAVKETGEQMKETDRVVKETSEQMKETDRQIKNTNKQMGELHNRFGEMAEHLVAPNITEKFQALGYSITRSSKNLKITDGIDKTLTEVDLLLENGSIVIAIEVKAMPRTEDVNDHINRMAVLRRDADKHRDARKYCGAIAGAIMSDEVRKYIHKAGFYAIEQTGDTVRITVPEGFAPREW